MGATPENTWKTIHPTAEKLNKTYGLIMKASNACKKPHVLFVYAGGHGATASEKQIFLLNTDVAESATFLLEEKLRYLASRLPLARVFAVYDCCRVPISNYPGLPAAKRGVGEDAAVEVDNPICKYFHITACGPGGVADANGGFALRLKQACEEAASKGQNHNFINVPSALQEMSWNPQGGYFTESGPSYLVPYGPHDYDAINKEFKKQPRKTSKATNILVTKGDGFPNKATEASIMSTLTPDIRVSYLANINSNKIGNKTFPWCLRVEGRNFREDVWQQKSREHEGNI